MVHSLHRRKVKSKQPSIIQKLADEILVEILKYSSMRDVLTTRLICRRLTAAGNTTLHDRLRVLYLHPSTKTLRQAVEICAHPVLSQSIKEVVLLGGKTCPSKKWNSADGYCGWPELFPAPIKASGSSALLWQEVAKEGEFRTVELLVRAVSRLPGLNRLTYAVFPEQPGFNLPSRAEREVVLSTSQMERLLAEPRKVSDLDLLLVFLENCHSIREFAFEALNHNALVPRKQLDAIHTGTFPLPTSSQFLTTITFSFGSSTRFATSSEIGVLIGWPLACRKALEVAEGLQTLNIIMWSETDWRCVQNWDDQESMVNTVLWGLGSRPLRELTIVTKVRCLAIH